MTLDLRRWAFTIIGEPCSKANSRRIVQLRGAPRSIKSTKALAYAAAVALQSPRAVPIPAGPIKLTARLFYASGRPDLDASVLQDALQGRLYVNDRQIRELHLVHDIDRSNPRAEVVIETMG